MHSSQAYFHTTNESHFFLGNAESNRYNEEVFKNSLKFAILGQVRRLMRQKDGNLFETCSQLSSPPEGFEEAVKAHFYLKRQQLIKARYQIIILVEA